MNERLAAPFAQRCSRYVSPYRELTMNLHYAVPTLIVERKASYSLYMYIYIYDTRYSVTSVLQMGWLLKFNTLMNYRGIY